VLTLAEMVPLGVEGAIIGTALYVGSFTLEEALRAAASPTTESTQA
jgi:phosphoribosylformimino-5-aminoimidazole carboxamide ribonucleotide (ProFAR) isomerase